MTLVEFLAPLKTNTHQARVLAVLYFMARYQNEPALTVDNIRTSLKDARVAGWRTLNIADVLNKSGHYVDVAGFNPKQRLWRLTDSGARQVRELLNLPTTEPEIEHDVGVLDTVIAKVTDPDVKEYLREAIKCLGVGALRACVVFLWSGVIRTLQDRCLALGGAKVTAALQTHYPKARNVSKLDDFSYIKDSITLLAAKDLGLLDKNQKDTLEEALNLRNRCGHPGKYRPGVKKVSAFIEDVVGVVFS